MTSSPTTHASTWPELGYGLGLRTTHYEEIFAGNPKVDWFEAVSENYLVPGGKPLKMLERVRERYPVVLHGVSMSIGSTDPIDTTYLKQLKALAQRIEPAWVSDHLCWTGIEKQNLHDLMPLPYTAEAVRHVANRVAQVQDYLCRQILLENVSSYLTYSSSEMDEWQFIAAMWPTRPTACCWWTSTTSTSAAVNHGFDGVRTTCRAFRPGGCSSSTSPGTTTVATTSSTPTTHR